MKRRGFFKALAGVGAAPAAAAVAAGAKALEAPDELEVLKAWIEQAFACEQGLLGAWADERGTMKYVTLACAARVSDWPDERAAKAALVAHERERFLDILEGARKAQSETRTRLIWRMPIQFNDFTDYDVKYDGLIATATQVEDRAVPYSAIRGAHEDESGNYYATVERTPVRCLRLRSRLYVPDYPSLVGKPEGMPTPVLTP